jgi:hypothetical protein
MKQLPEVMRALRAESPDATESELAMDAAVLMTTYEWDRAGRLPASHLDMWPDVQLLLTTYGYKVG